MNESLRTIHGVLHRLMPFAHCCAEGGGSIEGCSCVKPEHGVAWIHFPKTEYLDRFKARMLEAGPTFDDGSSISDYAEEVGPSYFEEGELGPEEAAGADMSYWGEE